MKTEYLGDGLYVSLENAVIVLRANVPTTDTIYLEPEVAQLLYSYIGRLMGKGEIK